MQFALTIAKTLGTRLMQLGKRFESVSNQNLTCRLAQILLNLAEMCGEERDQQIFIDRKITHQNIACMIGAARQSVTEILNSFIKNGLIKYDRNKRIGDECHDIVDDKACHDIVDSHQVRGVIYKHIQLPEFYRDRVLVSAL
jgi:hypothetical protein